MPEVSQRMALPVPSEFDDPWFDVFLDFLDAIDGHHFASFEDRNQFIAGGGDLAWNAGTSTLTWASALLINTPSTGAAQQLAAGNAIIANGEVWAVELVRGATNTIALEDYTTGAMPPDMGSLALALRVGNKLYFRNGRVLDTGSTSEIFEGEGASGPGGVLPLDARDDFTADGVATAFLLDDPPHARCQPRIYIDGVLQPVAAYSIAGATVTFIAAPLPDEAISVTYWTA